MCVRKAATCQQIENDPSLNKQGMTPPSLAVYVADSDLDSRTLHRVNRQVHSWQEECSDRTAVVGGVVNSK